MTRTLSAILVFITSASFAQKSYPVFANKQDSAGFAQVNEAIFSIFKTQQNQSSNSQLDSLYKLRMQYAAKIIGNRIEYVANQSFTAIDDVISGKVAAHTVTKLSITNASAKPPKALYQCQNIQELELLNTSIKKLPVKLSKLKKLKSIYVYNHKAKLKLAKNVTVKELLITGTEALRLPKSFKKFQALEDLNLKENIGLAGFPNIYRNGNLKKLTLYRNQITLTDLKAASGVRLQELNLQQNKIKTVPDAIGGFAELKKLTFNYNEIAEVKPGMANLKNLEEVSFYNNKLTEIPASVYALSKLKAIDLYHNEITKVRSDITQLSNLEILYLSNNLIPTLPDNLGELTKLRELYVSNNKLFVLPASLKNLSNLTVLRVNKNKLTDFPDFIFDLPKLENLDISSNDINNIPYKVTTIPTLNIFVISNNPVNKEEVNIAKIVHELRVKGTVVHQNYFNEQEQDIEASDN
jgi:Leucine-rich repeat (LRR) protein